MTSVGKVSPREVERILRGQYGQPHHHNKRDPLSELVFILLSTQTREAEYRRTFSALWTAYRSWERVRLAPSADLVERIRFGGFANRKIDLLGQLLNRVRTDSGRTSLRWLRQATNDDAEAYLTSLPGVGIKTAKCVMMYSLDRTVFPVDTHVWRISQRLGWVNGGKHPDSTRSSDLEQYIEPDIRRSLHVTMVAHGREVCRATARCALCLLKDVCPSGGGGNGG